jgi:hypothetical protein
MYNLSITNNYFASLFMDGGNQVIAEPNGGTGHLTNWGTHMLNIWGMGDLLFSDLGAKKLDAYTNPKIPWTQATWGGIVRYRGLEAYFRYEGQGQVNVGGSLRLRPTSFCLGRNDHLPG